VEEMALAVEQHRVWDNDEYIDDLIELAQEYMKAYGVGLETGTVEHRDNAEHLTFFHIAVVGAIAFQSEMAT
jgi:hypothetical protein